MDKMISYCGISCSDCGAYKATKNNDDKKRREVARQWSVEYKADIGPEDINCEGCLSTGKRVFNHCNVCEIRKCGIERKVVNCAHCKDYACEKIERFFEMVPDNKKTLDEIKANIE